MSYGMFNEKLQHVTFILELGQSMETEPLPVHHDKEDTGEASGYQADFNFTITFVTVWSNQTEGSGRAVKGFFCGPSFSISMTQMCLSFLTLRKQLSHSIALSQGQLPQQGQIHRCLWKFRSYLMGETGGHSRQRFHKLSKQSWQMFVTNL